MAQKLGKVIISPSVLSIIARQTTLSVPGVARMAGASVRRLLGSRDGSDVKVQVDDDMVALDLHIIAESDVNMLELSREIQCKVTRTIHEIVGMAVREINVHIADVSDEPRGAH
jgi:uncharacterized alkaline shock family protein YloU